MTVNYCLKTPKHNISSRKNEKLLNLNYTDVEALLYIFKYQKFHNRQQAIKIPVNTKHFHSFYFWTLVKNAQSNHCVKQTIHKNKMKNSRNLWLNRFWIFHWCPNFTFFFVFWPIKQCVKLFELFLKVENHEGCVQ